MSVRALVPGISNFFESVNRSCVVVVVAGVEIVNLETTGSFESS